MLAKISRKCAIVTIIVTRSACYISGVVLINTLDFYSALCDHLVLIMMDLDNHRLNKSVSFGI